MKIARVQAGESVFYGVAEGDCVRRIEGDIFGGYAVTQERFPLGGVRLLPPVSPPNIVCVGLNYKSHAAESRMDIPKRPVLFLKATTSLCGPGDAIALPAAAPDEVDYEAELAVVIGKTARNVGKDEALDYVLGYTCGNDVSARDCQLRHDSQWARGKSFDTFCPLCPVIETQLDPENVRVRTRLNGELVQDGCTSDMIFSLRELVSYCSQQMTLLPGTVLLTGTPDGVGFARRPPVYLRPGDRVEVEIEGIGILQNPVE